MLQINIDLEREDFEGIDFKNNKDRDFILNKFQDLIDSEEDFLEELINYSDDSIRVLNEINNNRGVMLIENEDQTEEYSLNFYTDITI